MSNGVFMMDEVYKALGWWGGTIHQVIAEIKRLRKIEEAVKKIAKSYQDSLSGTDKQ